MDKSTSFEFWKVLLQYMKTNKQHLRFQCNIIYHIIHIPCSFHCLVLLHICLFINSLTIITRQIYCFSQQYCNMWSWYMYVIIMDLWPFISKVGRLELRRQILESKNITRFAACLWYTCSKSTFICRLFKNNRKYSFQKIIIVPNILPDGQYMGQ